MRNRTSSASARARTAVLTIGALLLAACSGGSDSTTTVAPDPSSPVTDPATTPPTPSDPVDTAAVDTTSPPTTAAATTTTEPPPEILPIGALWQGNVVATVAGPGAGTLTGATVVDDTLWVTASRFNGPAAFRSTDGITWEEVVIGPPPSNGSVGISHIVALSPGGRLVAIGSRGTNCNANIDAGGGYRIVGICRDFRPIVHLSDDDGSTWRSVEPPAMVAPGGSSAIVEDVVVHQGQLVAAVTVRGPDWHGRLFTSADGENWAGAGDVRGAAGFTSIDDLLSDGETLAMVAAEHPCSSPDYNTPGWILGAQWPVHQRLFAGPDVTALAPVTNDQLALVPVPITYDCAVIDGFSIANEPYPSFGTALIGGRITLMDTTPPPEPEPGTDGPTTTDEVEPPPPAELTQRSIVQLIDGSWESEVITGLAPAAPRLDTLVDLDGDIALVRPDGSPAADLRVTLRSGDRWIQPEPILPVFASFERIAIGFEGAIFVFARVDADPYDGSWQEGEPADLVAYRSVPIDADAVPVCRPAPGADCRFHDLREAAGYPDFAGVDLSGIDLGLADLGEADFSGAVLTGAFLNEADGGDATFRDADLAGADLRDADLGDVTGANLSLARLDGAQVGFDTLPIVDGADLRGADLRTRPGAPPLSLAGLDLTDADVRGAFGEIVVITDVTGAVLDGVLFQRVDLRGTIGIETFDLTTFDVWDDSICPDGLPPTDGPIGTCAR